jgi:hypothetical protein
MFKRIVESKYRIESITAEESKKFAASLHEKSKAEQQKMLDQYVRNNHLSGEEISELMYDLRKEGITTLTKPTPEKASKPSFGLVEKLARKFSDNVKKAHSPAQLKTILERNKQEQQKGVCHTHDFFDANEFMADAFDALGLPLDPADAESSRLWSDAWSLAKENDFYV